MKVLGTIGVFVLIICICLLNQCTNPASSDKQKITSDTTYSIPVSMYTAVPNDSTGALIQYGRELMLQTAYYLGPQGIKGKYTASRVSCTNCHQNAGTKLYSFDLLTSFSRYPQYRARENRILSLADRVNNCIERPLNGKPIDSNSREMQAFLAYFKWLDSFIPENKKKQFGKPVEISFMNRPADPAKGAFLYAAHCSRCHGENGEGKPGSNNYSYQYPVLWGDSAYQPGSSIHRVIKMAAWLKANMPYDSATYFNPFLTDEEAMDVAAFVNDDRIHPRQSPASYDYPAPEKKPIDYGKGPFADTFSTQQHKFGPWQPIIDYWKKKALMPTY